MGNLSGNLRLFIAAWPDEAALEAMTPVDRWLDGLSESHRVVAPSQRHLTLAFLGDVTRERADEVAGIVENVCRDVTPIRAEMLGVLALPDAQRARVVAVELDAATGAGALMTRLSAAFRAAGVVERGSERPALPHVTVARARGRASGRGRGRAEGVDFSSAPRICGVFRIDSAAVMRSTLRSSGAVHETLRTMPLGGRD